MRIESLWDLNRGSVEILAGLGSPLAHWAADGEIGKGISAATDGVGAEGRLRSANEVTCV